MTPARPIAPGTLLFNEIKARGWTVLETAALLNYGVSYLWAIIDGDAPIDEEVAAALSRVLGTSADLWLNLEAAYRAEQAAADLLKENDKPTK